MIDLVGSPINIDLNSLIHVSDLIYVDGPLLSDFENKKGEHYLYYWVDVDETYNRWLVFRTDITTIQDYLNKKISFLTVIKNANDEFVISVDVDNDLNYNNQRIVFIKDLPNEYLPDYDSYYDFEVKGDLDIMALSKKFNSGILDIHIDGDNVNYGSMGFENYSALIPKVADITSSMSAKFVKMVINKVEEDQRKNKIKEQKKSAAKIKMSVIDQVNLNYQASMTGSLRIILKPASNEMHFEESYSDLFAKDIIQLFESSRNQKDIESFAEKYDKNIIKKFSELIRFLNECKMSIGVQWGNVQSKVHCKHSISKADTQNILKMLENIDYKDEENIPIIGKFYSINTKTGKFSFESSESSETYSGDFDKNLQKYILGISFSQKYKIVLNRIISEAVGNKKNIVNTITSFVEYKEQD